MAAVAGLRVQGFSPDEIVFGVLKTIHPLLQIARLASLTILNSYFRSEVIVANKSEKAFFRDYSFKTMFLHGRLCTFVLRKLNKCTNETFNLLFLSLVAVSTTFVRAR